MAKQKKIKPSYKIELLSHEKKKAHERLGCYDTPSLFQWSRAYFKEHGKLLEIDGFIFFRATGQEVLDSFEEGSELHSFALWASRNVPSSRRGDPPGTWTLKTRLDWCRFPDGTWVLPNATRVTATVGPKGVDHVPAHENDYSVSYVNNPPRYHELQKEFEFAWKKARTKYRKAHKDEQKKHEARKAKEAEIRKTEARMAVLLHIDKLTEELQGYKSLVEDSPEKLTRKRVRRIFDATNEMTSLNAELKDALGVK